MTFPIPANNVSIIWAINIICTSWLTYSDMIHVRPIVSDQRFSGVCFKYV